MSDPIEEPTTSEVRDIWVDWNLNPLPRDEGVALVPDYQEAFDRWLGKEVAHGVDAIEDADRLRRVLAELQNVREKVADYRGDVGPAKVLRWLHEIENA